jgi:hypothetical protein
MPLIQPAICIGLCVFSMLCWQFCSQSKRVRLRVTIRAWDWRRILERSQLTQHAPECGRRDSWWQEKVSYFLGLQMRVLWWWVWVAGGHGHSSPTPQFHRYTLCRSHELQVHFMDPTRRYVHGDSSPTWHPRCVRLHAFFWFSVYYVCTLQHPVSCNNVYNVNNSNNSVIIVHNVKQSELYLSVNPWQKIFYCMISAIIPFLFCM